MTVNKKGKKEASATTSAPADEEKTYRPAKDVMDLFYSLPELDASKRHAGIVSLLAKLKEDSAAMDYCVERLVVGLSSPRAAARIGYSTALSLLLPSIHEKWTAERLYELAEKKMDFKDEAQKNGQAIAHHLLATILINTGLYSHAYSVILHQELVLYRRFSFLAMSICHSVGAMLQTVDAKQFKTLLPPLRDYLETALTSSTPEFLLLLLTIRRKHAASLHEQISFVQKDGSCRFSETDLEALLASLKKCDKSVVNQLIKEILEAARSGEQFDAVYRTIIEKWAASGDESRVLERIFSTAELALQTGQSHKEVISIFSDALMKRLAGNATGKPSPQQRVLRGKITAFCNYITETLAKVDDSKTLLEIIGHLDRKGSFDQLTGSNVVEKLLSRLDQPSAIKWTQNLSQAGIRRIGHVFSHWPVDVKEAVLQELLTREKTEDLLMTVANAVDSLFYVKVRAGERAMIKLSEKNLAVLKAAFNALADKEAKKAVKKFANEELRAPLTVLYMNAYLWEQLSQKGDEKKAYQEALKEIETIAGSEDEENVSVLIDLLISLLSQTHKFVRTVVYYVYVCLLPSIKATEVQNIVESLMMDDAEMEADAADDADEEEDEDMEVDEKEEAEAESEEEEEENDDEEEDVDPQLVSRLEQALGRAAVKRKENGDFEEDDSDASLSDMDDETMFAMDDKLSSVFKAMNPKKERGQKSQAMQEFRSKVTDLLLFTVSAPETPSDVKLDLIVPLLQLSLVQLKRNAEGTVSKRTVELLEMLSKQKKITASPKKIRSLLDHLVNEAPNLSNPLLNSTVASLTAFVFSLGISNDEVLPEVKSAFVEVFNKFLVQEEGSLSSELATSAILKYPGHFVSEMTSFLEGGFNEEIRIFRRMEALQCVAALLNKAVVKTHPVDKSSAKKLAKRCADYLTTVVAAPSEIKPRFFATLLKVLVAASSGLTDSAKDQFEKITAPILEEMLEKDDLWKQLKKSNSASVQICGKQPLAVVKSIVKNLQQS